MRWGVVTADDRFVAILADDQLRIAPVADLDQVRAVGPGGAGGFGTFTPDGCWAVLTSAEETSGGNRGTTSVVPLPGAEPVLTIDGYSVVWIDA